MLFSENPDQLIDELKDYIQIASSYDCSRIQNLLLATENTYIIALLGTKLFNRIAKDQTRFPDEIGMCRKAVANITVYENFTLLNTLLLSGGFARVAGENTDSLYRYQEEDLKQIFRRNGFDQLDLIINHFLDKIDSFPEFKESEYYKAGRGELIPDRFVFSQYYKPIGHIVFRYMQAFIRRSEDLDISDIVDLSELRQAVLSDTISDQQQRTIELVRPVIVCLAVAYAMEDMGVNIDNAGIWMERRVAADGIREKNPPDTIQVNTLVSKYRNMANRYLRELQKHLSGATNTNPLIRDNKNKKTTWQ